MRSPGSPGLEMKAYEEIIAQQQASPIHQRALKRMQDPFPLALELRRPQAVLEDGGIRLGEIVGWRWWRVLYGALHSINQNRHVPWPAAGWKASVPSNSRIPAGFYAYRERERGLRSGLQEIYGKGDWYAFGSVLLWGDSVVEHETGLRAQWARIRSIDELHIIGDPRPSAMSMGYYSRRWNHPTGPQRERVEEVLAELRSRYGLVD